MVKMRLISRVRCFVSVAITGLGLVLGCPAGGGAEGEGEGEGEGEPAGPLPTRCVARAALRDVGAVNTVVVGDGTPASCTSAVVAAAIAGDAAAVTFDCGAAAHSIVVDAELVVDRDLIIDGGPLVDGAPRVTLCGGGVRRIMRLASSFERDTPRLTVQRLGFVDGNSPDDGNDPAQGGGAIQRVGGSLEVIGCIFSNNRAPASGQDVAGGAIMSIGGGDTVIVDSAFVDNSASNGGALGNLGNGLVVDNSRFDTNAATGSGGNPGNGGNGGSISVDGEGRVVDLCGVDIVGSRANAFGGGIFRVAYTQEPTRLHLVEIDGAAIADRDPSLGGGLYLQNSTITITSTTVRRSTARGAGGAYIGPGSVITFDNVSFDDNVAGSSLGGGLFLDGVVGGEVRFSTFSNNRAPGPVAFGGAVVGDASAVRLRASLFIDNDAGNGFNPISCTTAFQGGEASFQFPVQRLGNGGGDGGSDDPGSLCAPQITVADVELGAPEASGGVTVRRPAAGSAAAGAVADGCFGDAAGVERPTPCAAGAAEP